MRKIAAVACMVVALAACGSDSSDKATTSTGKPSTGSAACSSFDGQPVTADTFANPCTVDAATADQLNVPIGEQFIAGTSRTLCEDGRVLIWNDLGWGYEGEAFTAFHAGGVDGEYVAPQAERDSCAATS